jgi:uncharacterized membrane protein
MSVALLLMMLGLISMIGLIEVGYLYWAKRDTQKVADLAALAGAQQLSSCSASNQDNGAARGNAKTENGFTHTLTISCGTWDPVANSGITDHFATTASGSTPNAVKVVAQRPVAPFFAITPSLPNVSAEAVATGLSPVAVFSVGSTLVSVNGSAPLGQLLAGIGISLPNATLVGYNGLANVTITPSGLLNQLGVQVPADITVGGLNSLLASSVSAHALIDVLNAVVNAAGQQQLLSANATLVSALTSSLGTAPGTVTLGSNASGPGGLFAQIVTPDASAQTALNAQVNALQLITTAIGVATGRHAITLSGTSLSLPPISVTAAASVIEPPAIGIGGVGATAYTAQIRAYLDLNISPQTIPFVGGLLGALVNIQLDVPVAIDLVNAQATVTSLCSSQDSQGRSLANIAVTSSVLEMCVGNISQQSAFSTAGSCDKIPGASSNHLLLNATAVLGLVPLANVNTHFAVSALQANGSGNFYVGQTQNIPQSGTPLDIGTALSNLLTTLTTVLSGQATTSSPSGLASVISALSPILTGALNTVGSSILTPLLTDTLGIELGLSTVNLQSLQCHPVQLVY